jgi:serine/threonine protein kinase
MVVTKGTILSDTYRVGRTVAVGGMGAVFEAEHVRLEGHRVAIKVLLPDVAGDRETSARFRREAEICTRLQHPGIVKVTDFNVLEDGTSYLVMELLEGESLDVRMGRGQIPQNEVMAILRQIGMALEWAHAQGIVHRDLKPSNVFITRAAKDQVKILDFGVSKVLSEHTLHMGEKATVVGSPRYMSPEQAEGRNSDIGPASDQFSLAAIASEMLTGKKAFGGDTPAAILYKVVHGEPEGMDLLKGKLPPGVKEIIQRGLAKEPVKRYPSVRAFLQDLEAALFRRLKGKPTVMLTRAPSSSRFAGFFAILIVLALVGGVIWLAFFDPARRPQKPAEQKDISTVKPLWASRPEKAPKPVGKKVENRDEEVEKEDEQAALDRKVDGLLDLARAEYDRKKYKEVIRIAKETLSLKPTGRAQVLITLAHCALGEAEAARKAMEKVPASRKPGSLAQCRHFGLDLKADGGH